MIIALAIIIGLMLSGLTAGGVFLVKDALPGMKKMNAVKRAEDRARIAELHFQESQAEVNRMILEAKGNEEIERISGEGHQRALSAGSKE